MNIALVLAGGSGSRVGVSCPKQYLRVKDKLVISYCLETLHKAKEVDTIWIVADEKWRSTILGAVDTDKIRGFSVPGKTRQLSVCHGLGDIQAYIMGRDRRSKDNIKSGKKHTVLIHDAARPLLTLEMIGRCYEGLAGHEGVMPVLPMKDTVYFSNDGHSVSSLLNRSQLYAGQAPELFDFEKYYAVCRGLTREQLLQINGSTEPAVLAGMDIVMIPGDENNFKITTMEDLERFRQLMNRDY